MIPFQNSGSLNEFKTHKKFVYAIDIHRKGMELVYNIARYCNIEVININYNRFTVNYNDPHFPLRLCDIFKSNFEGSIFLLILILVICLSLNFWSKYLTFLNILDIGRNIY